MPENHNFEKDIQDLNARVSAIEHKSARTVEAFVKNDLGVPDYDGHRKAHIEMIEQAKVVSGYKRTLTQRILDGWLAVAGLLLGAGAIDWLRVHIK